MDDLLPGLSQSLNVHPIFVHFPIALWSFALLLWTLGQFLDRKDFLSAGRWALYAGTLGGLLTVATGYVASNGFGHDSPGHDFVHVHRNFMLVATGMALVTTCLAFFLREAVLRETASQKARWLVCGALFLTVTVTTLGADRGALLVYTYGMGTKTAPSGSSDHGGSDHGTTGHGASDHGTSDHGSTTNGSSDHHDSTNSKDTPKAGDHH